VSDKSSLTPLLCSYVDRRELLGREMNKQKLSCPKCETRQIQLIGYMDEPAKWKCRHCRHVFTKELEQT
jgi:transposase-like protein